MFVVVSFYYERNTYVHQYQCYAIEEILLILFVIFFFKNWNGPMRTGVSLSGGVWSLDGSTNIQDSKTILFGKQLLLLL